MIVLRTTSYVVTRAAICDQLWRRDDHHWPLLPLHSYRTIPTTRTLCRLRRTRGRSIMRRPPARHWRQSMRTPRTRRSPCLVCQLRTSSCIRNLCNAAGACFCPFVQRVWAAFEYLEIPYHVRHRPVLSIASETAQSNILNIFPTVLCVTLKMQ